MEIFRAEHLEGARAARGTAVVIDVLRAFTTAACAFAGGARDLLLVDSVEAAFNLKRRFPDSFLMGEVDGCKVDGFDHGNSPSEFPRDAVRGRRIIQCTGSGTRCAVAASGADALFVSSLAIAGATAQAVGPAPVVTLVASMGCEEGDDAVADYLEGLLRGAPPAPGEIVRRVRQSPAGRRIASGDYPQYPPADLDVCARLDAFDFAIRVSREGDLLVARRVEFA
ncbi:MAG TPA: 2-phosphosulfolactate phosphatase [Planctomycetota bacterium]|nr:2-phosphosulfolactate phosphatase [Planctomycetota bacterium]